MDALRKTVVIISPAFPANESEDYWGPSQQLLVRAMKENFPDYDFEVLALLYPYHQGEYHWHNIPVTSYHGIAYPGIKRLSLWWKARNKLKRISRQKQIAGILSFWCKEAALVGTYFARRNRLPHYCWLCGQDARQTNQYIKLIRPRPHELIAISDFVAGEFFQNHQVRPQYIIPNAIDEKMFSADINSTRDIDILGVGALIPLKQFDQLIQIVARLRKHLPNINAKICGIGEERENLSALINRLGLQPNIEMMGARKHEEIIALMHRTKLLIHPSAYEGFSTVCLEALYAGAQGISYVKPMTKDIRNWHVVSPGDGMYEKALVILKSGFTPERVKTWSIEEIAVKMMSLFEKKV